MDNKKYKIVCMAQIYNELEKGNLKRFVRYIVPLCDALVVYDDASTDGSFEYMKEITPYIIRGKKNDFEKEIFHKQLLLDKAKQLKADFVFYLDIDEVLSVSEKDRLQTLAQMCIYKNIDGLQFHKINIWRSATWKRVDSMFDIGWYTHFWRVKSNLRYTNIKPGLHQAPYPPQVKKVEKVKDVAVLHYGFSDEKNIAYKYLTYKSHGQLGYDMLDRLISEEKLKLKKIPKKFFPENLYIYDENKPLRKTYFQSLQLVEKYRSKSTFPKYSIVCLIYKSVEWLEFVYAQVLKYTDLSNAEFYFIANDATIEVKNYINTNKIPHYIWNNTDQNKKEWYINNVYRAWNYGAKKAKGEFVIFINSDMAFTDQWLENLIAAYNKNNCLTSRLIESGKLPSGQYGISKNFGRSTQSYREEDFQKYARKVSNKKIEDGGLFMPLLIKREDFISVGGYPEGNVVPGSSIFNPKIAERGEACISGDVILMEKLKKRDIKHQTVFGSIVYHFQEGEMGNKKMRLNKYLSLNTYARKINTILNKVNIK